MTRIGVVSDTHCLPHPNIWPFLSSCDEIWHAGDIGNLETLKQFCNFKPTRAVFGNCDGQDIRVLSKEIETFIVEGQKVLMTHIGGYPGRYQADFRPKIERYKPDIVVVGHSHILKVIYDRKLQHLHINPGAAGKSGLHTVITALRFELTPEGPKNLEILEIPRP